MGIKCIVHIQDYADFSILDCRPFDARRKETLSQRLQMPGPHDCIASRIVRERLFQRKVHRQFSLWVFVSHTYALTAHHPDLS